MAEAIAGTGVATDERPDRSAVELADVERRIGRLVDAVEAGTFESSEVGERLKGLRQQREALRAHIACQRPAEVATAAGILKVLDELDGLVGAMEAFTRENREAIYRAANLRVTYHPAEREVDLALSLAPGGVASERVGGGT